MKPSEQEKRDYQRLRHSSYQPTSKVGSPDTSPEPKKEKKPRSVKKIILRALIFGLVGAMLLLAVFVTWNVRNFSYASEQIFGEPNVLKTLPRHPIAMDSSGRTNILVIGSGSDQDGHGGADLTDTILIVSLDSEGSGYMLSIPRDLYIAIPEYGSAKINEAFPFGERSDFSHPDYRDGGVGILEYLITDNFGLDIHYSVIVNFSAVEQIVSAIGGITVTIDSPDERGLFDPNFRPHEGGPLKLENGPQQIDGQTALRLTRARGSAGGYGFPQSDFNRTQNQQKVIIGIVEALELRDIIDPRSNKELFDTLGDHIVTDLPLNRLIPMGRLLLATNVDALGSHTLRDLNGENYLSSYTTPNGLAALIPSAGIGSFDQIRAALEEIHK